MEEITAKEVYVFAEYCLKVQQSNIKSIKTALEENKIPYKQRQQYTKTIKIAEEKCDFLENTKSIVLALFNKSGQIFHLTEEEIKAICDKYGLEGVL